MAIDLETGDFEVDASEIVACDRLEFIEDVLHHYRKNVWPLIEAIVTFHATDISSEKMLIEGSALLPELVINLNFSIVTNKNK